MNPLNHWTWNLENPRRIFLICVVCFLIGDILGIQNLLIYWIYVLGFLFLSILLSKTKVWVCIFIFLSWVIWYILWWTSYHHRWEIYNNTVKVTGWFTYKGTITGTIKKTLYRKERSMVYVFSIDNFDNFDKINKDSVPEIKSAVDKSNFWVFLENHEKTIFIELPSNLTLTRWDRIEFEWKIKPNINFPLIGYDRYAFLHWGNGYIFLTNFKYLENKEPSFIISLHEKWENIFTTSFPKEVAWIVLGMTIGSTKYLTETIKDAFLTSGITHILVVSGSNIAFLILFLSFFIKYLHTSRWFNIVIVVICIIFYVGIVGIEVPVIRAAIMGILSFLIASAWLRASSRSIIGLTLVILIIIEPLSPLYDAGFWLSFGATLGILLFQKQTESIFKRLHVPNFVRTTLSLTLGASLWSLPILIYHFGNVALYSIITNILISGFLGWILFSATFFWILSLIWFPFLKIVWLLIYIPTKIIISISHFFSHGITFTPTQEQSTILTLFLLWFILYFYIFDELNS
jgi:ComEC/Rec2-related protein